MSSACGLVPTQSRVRAEENEDAHSSSPEMASGICFDSTVQTLEMPKDHDNPKEGTFRYAYQFIRTPGALGTIIHIPGGPGDSSITEPEDLGNLTQFSHILIDPRAVGCNADPSGDILSDDLVTTHQHANDLIFLVRELQLKNYIFWGVSYGTAVATVATDLARQLPKDQQPQGTILEGSFDGALKELDFAKRFAGAWDRKLAMLPGLLDQFKDPSALPFGFSREDWELLLQIFLSVGGDAADRLLTSLATKDSFSVEIQEKYRNYFQSLINENSEVVPGARRFFNLVGCREVFSGPAMGLELRNGRFDFLPLTSGSKDFAEHCNSPELVNAFDAKRYDLSQAPLYYFHGDEDPNTPLASALRHHAHHKARGPASFFEIVKAGHGPLKVQLEECQGSILEQIFKQGTVEESLCSSFVGR